MNELNKSCVMTHYVSGMPTTDGAGVKLTRMIGTPELDMLDPFKMPNETQEKADKIIQKQNLKIDTIII